MRERDRLREAIKLGGAMAESEARRMLALKVRAALPNADMDEIAATVDRLLPTRAGPKPREPDACKMLLNEQWLIRHFTIQALLPGLTPREIKALKRKMREAQKRRHFWCKILREEVCATLARWEAERPTTKPVQLELPLTGETNAKGGTAHAGRRTPSRRRGTYLPD